jgi:hypothetical protein
MAKEQSNIGNKSMKRGNKRSRTTKTCGTKTSRKKVGGKESIEFVATAGC